MVRHDYTGNNSHGSKANVERGGREASEGKSRTKYLNFVGNVERELPLYLVHRSLYSRLLK